MGEDKPTEIIAQCYGLKALSIEGGWRLSLDLFEARVDDIKSIVHLVNKKAVVRVVMNEEREADAGEGAGPRLDEPTGSFELTE
jgi:hypothetical protein